MINCSVIELNLYATDCTQWISKATIQSALSTDVLYCATQCASTAEFTARCSEKRKRSSRNSRCSSYAFESMIPKFSSHNLLGYQYQANKRCNILRNNLVVLMTVQPDIALMDVTRVPLSTVLRRLKSWESNNIEILKAFSVELFYKLLESLLGNNPVRTIHNQNYNIGCELSKRNFDLTFRKLVR